MGVLDDGVGTPARIPVDPDNHGLPRGPGNEASGLRLHARCLCSSNCRSTADGADWEGEKSRVSSSQSYMRCSSRERAIGSQCRSAPSALANGTSTLCPGSESKRRWDWPGQDCSPSGSVTISVVEMLATRSRMRYCSTVLNVAKADRPEPYGFARHCMVCRCWDVADSIPTAMFALKLPSSSASRSSSISSGCLL